MAKKKKSAANIVKTSNLCISIGPWGATDIDQSYRHDLELILSDVTIELGMDYKPFWDLATADMPSGIFEALTTAKLAFADLRGLNPNVMYELGIRHAFNLPTVLLKDSATKLAWDIDKNFVITYPLPIQVSKKQPVIDDLVRQANKVIDEAKKNNPVFSSFVVSVQRSASIDKLNVGVDIKSTLDALLNKVDRITTMNGSPRIPEELTSNHLEAWDLVSRKGLSQIKAAEAMGLSQGRVSQLLQEYKDISGNK